MPEDAQENLQPHATGDAAPAPPDPKPPRSKLLRALIWLLILGGFGILCWMVLRQKPSANTRVGAHALTGPVTINVVTATRGNLGVYVQAIGTVTPVYTDTIAGEATGLITQVKYREGQMVRKGQQLIVIDPRPYEAQVLQAQGTLEHDANLLAEARMDLQRYQDAWKRNAIPRQTLEDQEKLVLQEEGAVKSDEGTLHLDQVNLSYCYIKAPISGRVGLRLVDPGNLVIANSNTPLAVIAQLQPITVVFVISEDDVASLQDQLRRKERLEVDAFDRSDQTKLASGRLLATDNLIDTATGTLKLRAIFDNRDTALFPNLFVNARLLLQTLNNVVTVPSSAIQQNGPTSFVYLIQNGVAHLRDVKTGVTDRGVAQVDGIQPGDVIANSGFQRLQEGSKVIVAKQALAPRQNETRAP